MSNGICKLVAICLAHFALSVSLPVDSLPVDTESGTLSRFLGG